MRNTNIRQEPPPQRQSPPPQREEMDGISGLDENLNQMNLKPDDIPNFR